LAALTELGSAALTLFDMQLAGYPVQESPPEAGGSCDPAAPGAALPRREGRHPQGS
jgi:hypothetical protein